MFVRIRKMVAKEFIQVFRDSRMKAIIFLTPIIQLLLFGYAVTTDVTNVKTAFLDLDRTVETRELARRIESSGYFDISRTPGSPGEIRGLLDGGEVLVAVQVNRGFSRDLKSGSTAGVQVIVDGTDSNTATVAMDYLTRIIGSYAAELEGTIPAVDLRTRAWYNPDLRSRNYNIPGVIAIIIMLTSLLLTSMAVVREREIGTMEQLMVTPLKPVELILGKTLPFAAIGFFDMFLVTALALFWFGVPIKGSLVLLSVATAVYLISVLGVGLFISTISRTQQQALMATFLFFLPAVLLSGFMFPIENMPLAVQYGTYLNPLRYFLVIIRGIFLKGVGPGVLWPQMACMLALGVFVLAVSSMRFRKRLE